MRASDAQCKVSLEERREREREKRERGEKKKKVRAVEAFLPWCPDFFKSVKWKWFGTTYIRTYVHRVKNWIRGD